MTNHDIFMENPSLYSGSIPDVPKFIKDKHYCQDCPFCDHCRSVVKLTDDVIFIDVKRKDNNEKYTVRKMDEEEMPDNDIEYYCSDETGHIFTSDELIFI